MPHETERPAATTWHDADLPAERRVASLLAAMSLEEKVGQLGGYWFDTRGPGEVIAPMQDTLGANRPAFDDAAAQGLGHLTRVVGTEPVPADEGAAKLAGVQARLARASRLGLPAIAHEECLTGVAALGATVYPIPLAWGATFHPELVEEVGAAIGRDLRRLGVHQGLAPVMDVVRDYRWGRVEETIGEDPYTVGTIGAAYVRGMESTGTVATLKHFVGYSASRSARNHAPVSVGRRELADVLLPPFEMALREGGARSVMNSYSAIDEVPVGASEELLTSVLRDAWGFTGTVVSDYWAVAFLATTHGVAADVAEAGALALRAGIDVELPDVAGYGSRLVEQVRSGAVAEELVDRAARRVLHQKLELGLLDATPPTTDAAGPIDLDSPANRLLARTVAEQSIVLLHNAAGVLPLGDGPARVALVGPLAQDPRTLMGCYSYPVHVLPRHPELGLGIEVPTIAEALAAELPAAAWAVERGCDVLGTDRAGIAAAVAAARDADVCVLTVGDRSGMFGRGSSGEGCDAADLRLPGVQDELVDAVLATGTPTVLVVVSGRPYALGAHAPRAAAVVQAFMPGEEGASAIAGVLSGRINPSGKLPVQVPAVATSGPQTYLGSLLTRQVDRISNLDLTPAYPFGHGLSYTQFRYGDLRVTHEDVPTDGAVELTVELSNVGPRAGAEVVQLYLSDPVAQVNRPVRQLVGYRRVELAPGESAVVSFTVHADLSSFTGIRGERVVEPGTLTFMAGGSSEGDWPRAGVRLTGPCRTVDHARVLRSESTVRSGAAAR
ncbi:beta-glucosidase [Actinotalea sp. JY-7876]|uniref:beta-xylosidase/alpha-l-arabinosidase n=1 Tax=Actinotalea sp. JY-7876 TaxID=2758442 RepID=UPI002104BF65|nr:glycoside hydrolase family 3 N-terminal domain-containing protein [Actinotalea sp. JY-7876]